MDGVALHRKAATSEHSNEAGPLTDPRLGARLARDVQLIGLRVWGDLERAVGRKENNEDVYLGLFR